MDSDIVIDELKRLHAAAPPGEWKPEVPAWNKHRRNCKTAVSSPTGTVLNTVTPKVPRDGVIGNRPPGDCKTAKYIAALHNAFPALLDRLEAAEAVCHEAARFCEEINEDTGECDLVRLPNLHSALDKYEELTESVLPAPPEAAR